MCKNYITIIFYISVILTNITGYQQQFASNYDALRPIASVKGPALLAYEAIKVSGPLEEAEFWYLYLRFHELNRKMDSWFTKVALTEDAKNNRIEQVISEIDDILPKVYADLPQGRSFVELSDENRRLMKSIQARYRLIRRVYLRSLEFAKRPDKRKRFDRLNQRLVALNAKQREELHRRAGFRLALAKKFLGKGPKRRDSQKDSPPNVSDAMALIMGTREDMGRIATEIYWKRVREYILAHGTGLAQQIEAEGLFDRSQQAVSLDSWDVNVLERGTVTVRMKRWRRVLTHPSGKDVIRAVWEYQHYQDIVTACRAHLEIMLSQDKDILTIFSMLAQLRYIVREITPHEGKALTETTKKEALAGLELVQRWLHRGQVDEKTVGAIDMRYALDSLRDGNADKAISFIENVRTKLWERVARVRERIRKGVYRRFVELNRERRKLVNRDDEIKNQLHFTMQLLGIGDGVDNDSAANLHNDSVREARRLLGSLLAAHFAQAGLISGPRAEAKKKIDACLSCLDELQGFLAKKERLLAGIVRYESEIEGIKEKIYRIEQSIGEAEKLALSVRKAAEDIEAVKTRLSDMLSDIPANLRREVENRISALKTAAERIDTAHCENNLRAIIAWLNVILQDDSLDTVTKDELAEIAASTIDIVPVCQANHTAVNQFSIVPKNLSFKTVTEFLERGYANYARAQIDLFAADIEAKQRQIARSKLALNATFQEINRLLLLIYNEKNLVPGLPFPSPPAQARSDRLISQAA